MASDLSTVGLGFGKARQQGWPWSRQELPEQRPVGAVQFLIWMSDLYENSSAILIVVSGGGICPVLGTRSLLKGRRVLGES